MPTQLRISEPAMSELEPAFKAYCLAVEKSELSQSSQATYVDTVNAFMRWLRYDFEPGSRLSPYSRKKPTKDASA
jgi:hypothetical protein